FVRTLIESLQARAVARSGGARSPGRREPGLGPAREAAYTTMGAYGAGGPRVAGARAIQGKGAPGAAAGGSDLPAAAARPGHGVAVERGPVVAHEAHLADRGKCCQRALDLGERDAARIVDRKPVGARADRRKGDGRDRVPRREHEAAAVAARQQIA